MDIFDIQELFVKYLIQFIILEEIRKFQFKMMRVLAASLRTLDGVACPPINMMGNVGAVIPKVSEPLHNFGQIVPFPDKYSIVWGKGGVAKLFEGSILIFL